MRDCLDEVSLWLVWWGLVLAALVTNHGKTHPLWVTSLPGWIQVRSCVKVEKRLSTSESPSVYPLSTLAALVM